MRTRHLAHATTKKCPTSQTRFTCRPFLVMETGRQVEQLNFEPPAAFVSRLGDKRWAPVGAPQGQGDPGVRELGRRAGSDVKHMHEHVQSLLELGLVERTDPGGVVCPFTAMHIDMHLLAPKGVAA